MTLRELTLRDRPHLRVLRSTTSTNDDARAWVRDDAPDGATVVADHQTQGRGRSGRTWVSPPGVNLYVSCILRAPINRLRLAPLVGALAVREAVAVHLPAHVAVVKWPNDILVDGMKVAGILSELVQDPAPAGVVGMGINVNMNADDFPDDLRWPAASLFSLSGEPLERRSVLETLLQQLDRFRGHLHEDPRRLVNTFVPHCITLGKAVRISQPGCDPFVATARGIDPDGLLVVETGDGATVRIEAGDVDLLDS